ncbi:hypothetical protein PHYBOEH_004095 [Phytophthora boehmeriae]|uniref:EF-hand domain-containing protein n=1 Tax=Phytophthora boehmeriae TaxID=109152 RepID=A0A8T1XA05_9STRA|nr:hypothetical protein PHYBOEH_004095 [Phytophthora boehmeriae]
MQTFYTETKAIQQELEMLRVTIYEQEIRFREYELQLKEQQESLEFLVQQVKEIPTFYSSQAAEITEQIPAHLPAWSLVAAKMVWQQFDSDHDGILTRDELSQLKDHLRKNHENIDEILAAIEGSTEHLTAQHLLSFQIGEKEKWQRYCWELEERLHEAMHSSYVKERDLWRTKDAKKEESRKSMLMYIAAQKGKRHYRMRYERPAETAVFPRVTAPKAGKQEGPGAIMKLEGGGD